MFERELIAGKVSPAMAAAVVEADAAVLGRADAVVLLEACERLICRVQAVQVAAIGALAGPEPVPETPDRERLDEAAEEVAVALGGNRQFQLGRVQVARFVLAWLPETWQAMWNGRLGWYEAGLIMRAAEQLDDPDKRSRLESMVVPRGSRDLARRLRRALARLDPAAMRKRAEERRRERLLVFSKDRWGSGEASMTGQGPSELMALVASAIELDAKPRLPGDCRTVATRRFDVLLDWARERLGLPVENVEVAVGADGHVAALSASGPSAESSSTTPSTAGPPSPSPPRASTRCGTCGRTGPPKVPINVTVSMETLVGLSEEPAELTGWGLIDPDTARTLAADGEWRRWLVEEGTGRLLDVGSGTHRPNAALERFVRARDRTCRFPGCHLPAVRCDLDHTVAFEIEGGSTTADNLTSLCRRHHRLKHESSWSHEVSPTGWATWTAPSGRIYSQPPEVWHEADWREQEEAADDASSDELALAGARSHSDQPPF